MTTDRGDVDVPPALRRPVPFNLGECLEFGWTTFKQHAGTYALLSFVLLLVWVGGQVLAAKLRQPGVLLAALLAPLYWTCASSLAWRAARGETPTFADAFRPLTERQGDYFMIAIGLTIGTLLCGVGVVITWFLFLFAPLLAFEGRDFKEALDRSKNIALEYPGDVAVLVFVVLCINAIGLVMCSVGLIATMPITTLTVVRAYQQLTAARPPEAAPAA
jgi:uncharacterized membrane protein